MSNYDKWYIIRKLLCSTFRMCKKICKFAKIEFFIAKSSFIVKMFAKKNCPKNDKLYIFEKPLTMPFQICKYFCKILINLIFNQEKLKMCKFPLTGCLQKICNFFFAKLVQSVSLCHRLSKKLNFIKIWQVKVGQNKDLVCYRQNQSFRQCAWELRQLVLKPGFRPKKRALGMWEKSEKSASDQYFLSYVKKNYRGGSICPPPSRNQSE